MKKYTTSYDVLNVFNEETADIIQSFIGKDCLGLYNEDGLYDELVYNVCSDDRLMNRQV